MTLSRFLRDYIYIPLGGNKNGNFRTYVNLMATFVIGGFWHGAGWTFLFWGFLHGLALCIHRVWTKLGFKMWTWLAWFITFNFVNVAWIFFRAKEWDDAIKVLIGMTGINGIVLAEKYNLIFSFLTNYGITFDRVTENIGDGSKSLIWILLGIFFILFFKNSMEKSKKFKINIKTLFITLIYFLSSILSLNQISEFLYFNF